jgi:IS5 family transposase
MKQFGLFDMGNALERLSRIGDPLEELERIMDWSIFVEKLDKIRPDKTQAGVGGRPPFKNLVVFKVLLLKHLNGVSNGQLEFLITDRLSWKRFLGMELSDKAPDENTIWSWEELLTKSRQYEELFDVFNQRLAKMGVIAKKGSIVDSTFVDVPRQRISREERESLKRKELPDRWLMPGNANELSQRDAEASWAKKGNETHFGYKDHIEADSESKIITDFEVTPANVHDSQEICGLIDENVPMTAADSAYSSQEIRENLLRRNPDMQLLICEKGTRGHPLTDEQKARNREISHVRARVEHVFGRMHGSMGGIQARCIGLTRVRCSVCLKNLAYNILQYGTLVRHGRVPLPA